MDMDPRLVAGGTQIATYKCEDGKMDALVISATLFGSFLGAFALQKVALEGLLRFMSADRRTRQ